jgi:hypothetical protein
VWVEDRATSAVVFMGLEDSDQLRFVQVEQPFYGINEAGPGVGIRLPHGCDLDDQKVGDVSACGCAAVGITLLKCPQHHTHTLTVIRAGA